MRQIALPLLLITFSLLLAVLSGEELRPFLEPHLQRVLEQQGLSVTDPDIARNITELITSKGYPCENHYVTTSDGYVLGIQRIPFSPRNKNTLNKKVVFLQHGVVDSATTWALNFPSQSLAFILADEGFDVWLGNIRGNRYSRKNNNYTPNDAQFWQFSWDEHANVDLPAMVDYALQKSGQSKLAYIGHSQGTAMGFTAFTRNKELSEKVTVFVALAPVVYVGHPGSEFIKLLATLQVDTIIRFFGVKEFLPDTKLLEFLLPNLCKTLKYACTNIYCAMGGGCDSPNVNATRLPVYLSHLPSGTSVQNMAHWAQAVRTKLFQAYDFGNPKDNMKHYNQTTPIVYKVEDLMVKTLLYYGDLDPLATVADIEQWSKMVPKDKLLVKKLIPTFTHGDFVWGVRANELIYQEAIQYIKQSFQAGKN